MSMRLNCILQDLSMDTLLDHFWRAQICGPNTILGIFGICGSVCARQIWSSVVSLERYCKCSSDALTLHCSPPRLDSFDTEGNSLSLCLITGATFISDDLVLILILVHLFVLIHMMQKATPYLSVISRGRQKPQRFRPVCQNVLIDEVNELKLD